MFCPNCGRNNPDYVASCSGCGTVLRADAQQNAAYQQPNYSQPNYQQPPYQQPNYPPQQNASYPYQSYPSQMPYAHTYPMKWFKFLIYFALFFGAVGNVMLGIVYLTGAQYVNYYGNNVSDLVYNMWPTLQTMDILMGASCIAMAVFGIYTRFRLSGYRKNAGNCVFLMYIIPAVLYIVYAIAVYAIVGESDAIDLTSTFVSFAMDLAIACCNKTYFAKRSALFVN